MAQRKISELPSLSTPDGAEELVVNDSGVSKKVTIANAVANTTPKIHTHTVSNITDAGNTATLDLGTISGTVSEGDHAHTGIYEAADVTILKDADIGVNVQAYDATIVVDADIGVNVQAYDATIVVDADIGSTVQAYDADTAKTDTAQAFTEDQTFEAITETKTTKSASFTPDLSNDGTLYSCSGTMTITMPTAESGKSFTIIHATATSITWAGTIKWNGGSAPTAGSGIDIYVFVSDGTNWYGMQSGTGFA